MNGLYVLNVSDTNKYFQIWHKGFSIKKKKKKKKGSESHV